LQTEFLEKSDVLRIHARQIEKFGGSFGIRDEGLLKSAIAQPQATFGEMLLHPTLHEQAAAYLYHIAMNHPFVDGNKRTAFATMDTFLRLNRCQLELPNDQAYEWVIQVVEGRISKAELGVYLGQVMRSPENS
jgi:death on curing protein